MTAPQSRKTSKPVLFLASSTTKMLKWTISCYVLAGFSRINCSRDGAKEGEGEIEETTEKNRQIAGNLSGGRERWGRRETIYLYFPYNINFSKMKIFLEVFVWVVQIFWQINSCLIGLADEMWLVSVRYSIQAAIHPKASGMFLSNYVVLWLTQIRVHGSEKLWSYFVSGS